jgi:hypothetical protein
MRVGWRQAGPGRGSVTDTCRAAPGCRATPGVLLIFALVPADCIYPSATRSPEAVSFFLETHPHGGFGRGPRNGPRRRLLGDDNTFHQGRTGGHVQMCRGMWRFPCAVRQRRFRVRGDMEGDVCRSMGEQAQQKAFGWQARVRPPSGISPTPCLPGRYHILKRHLIVTLLDKKYTRH